MLSFDKNRSHQWNYHQLQQHLPVNVLSHLPAFHSFIVLSAEPVNINPCSGSIFTAHIAAVWPCKKSNIVKTCQNQIQSTYFIFMQKNFIPVMSSYICHSTRLLLLYPMIHLIMCQISQMKGCKLEWTLKSELTSILHSHKSYASNFKKFI